MAKRTAAITTAVMNKHLIVVRQAQRNRSVRSAESIREGAGVFAALFSFLRDRAWKYTT
jgi:hypothetical protein